MDKWLLKIKVKGLEPVRTSKMVVLKRYGYRIKQCNFILGLLRKTMILRFRIDISSKTPTTISNIYKNFATYQSPYGGAITKGSKQGYLSNVLTTETFLVFKCVLQRLKIFGCSRTLWAIGHLYDTVLFVQTGSNMTSI